MDDYVWVGSETDQPWMQDGSYLVARRIRMLIESWDADYLADQEKIFGRHKRHRRTADRHVGVRPRQPGRAQQGRHPGDRARLPHPAGRARSTTAARRSCAAGYSYTDGMDPVTGQLDAGPVLHRLQKDPRTQFVPIQTSLGANDLLNEYITHTGSGLFAVPPGVTRPATGSARRCSPPDVRPWSRQRSSRSAPGRTLRARCVARCCPGAACRRPSAGAGRPRASRRRRARRRRAPRRPHQRRR